MNHELQVNDLLINESQTGLKILTQGHAAYINPTSLFSSHRMAALIDRLKSEFDLVVLDSPPIMAVPDTRILGGLVDSTIYVLNWDKTPKNVVANGLQILKSDGHNNLAGIVLQKVNLAQYGRYGYGDSGYYYSYGRYKEYYTN
jgi:Mrp family chromosome partitioning ATPase